MKQKYQERLIALGLFTLLVILLIPLLLIAGYNVMSADDYTYINIAQNGLLEGQGVFDVLWAQMKNAYDCWASWQGQYFVNWLILSFLALAGPEKYYLVIVFTMIPMLLAEFFLAYVILGKGFGATFSQVSIAILPIMIYNLCFTPSMAEAYYWLCGAVTYTTTYAISLFAIGLLIYMLITPLKKYSLIFFSGILFVMTVCLGGSNFVTGLFLALVFLGFACYTVFVKHRYRIIYCLNFVIFTICFLITALSPGATNRRTENAEVQVEAVKAIFLSLIEAVKYIHTWTMWFTVLLMLALIPLFLKIIKKKNYKFPAPFLVLVISFGLYAAQFTPNQYALGILGAYRVQNIYRFQMIFWLIGNEFYILGYLHRRFPKRKLALGEKLSRIPFMTLIYSLVAVCIIFQGAYKYIGPTFAPYSAYKSLRDGTAAIYYQEYQERLKVLEDDSVQEVALEPYSCAPYALFFSDFKSFFGWENQAAAEYFHKKSIIVK